MFSKYLRWLQPFSLLALLAYSGADCAANLTSPAPDAQRFATVYGADQFSKGLAPAWAIDNAVPAAKPSAEPNTMRLADTQLRWGDSGEVVYFHRAIQANNPGGIQKLGQLQLEFNPAYQTMSLHSIKILRGETVIDKLNTVRIRFLERELGLEQSIYNGSVTVALLIDDVRVGDTLEYTYTVYGANPVFKGTIAESAYWESEMPVLWRRVSVQAPVNRQLAYRFIGANNLAANVKPTEKKAAGLREWVFEQRDVTPFRFEDFYPPGYQPMTWLQISEYKNWNQVAVWAAELFQVPSENGADYNALVARLQAIADPSKRAAEALAFVQSEIRYTSVSFGENSHRPAAPDEVLSRRYGDCKDKTLLLVALYRSLGMEAKPVLLSMSTQTGLNEWLPSTASFDHAIVRLDWQKKTYWLDPTAIQNPHSLATIGKLHEGSDVLVVDPKTDRLQQIERSAPDVFTVHERVHLDNLDGAAVLEKVSIATGVAAEALRSTLAQTSLDQIKKNLLNEVQYIYADPEWIGDPIIDDDVENNKITYTGKYRIKNYAEKITEGWMLHYRPAYISSFFGVPEAPHRTAPYAIRYPVSAVYSHEVELPDGVTLTAPDASQTIGDTFFNLHQLLQWQGHSARAEYTFTTLAPAVAPAEMDRYIADIRRVQNEMHTAIFVSRDRVAAKGAQSDLERYRKAAEGGDAAAQFELGMLYGKGSSVPRDFHQAYNWLRLAAEQGHANAQYYLGILFEEGEGVRQDYLDAAVWYRKAAEQNMARAQYRLGYLYYGAHGVRKDLQETVLWWSKAAEQGDESAQIDLGRLYAKGEGVPVDFNKAYTLWKKAADKNSAAAQNNIGVCYEFGEGCKKDLQQALTWYRKAAEQNYALAQYHLGLFYSSGRGVEQDYQQAYSWFRKAADQGQADAQYCVGFSFARGQGVPEDFTQARIWFLRAAEQGVADAQFALGVLYDKGLGIDRDIKQATLWYKRAASQGNPKAQYNLGLLSKGDSEAYLWFSLADQNGHAEARKQRDSIAANMSAPQIADADKRVRGWTAKDAVRDLVPAVLLTGGQPEYPEKARRLGVEGEVVMDLTIDKQGAVDAAFVFVSSGSNYLDDAAKEAVLRYVFTPAKQDDTPVASQKKLKINFKLNSDADTASAAAPQY